MSSKNIDRLSSLPDEVLTHILDFIPTRLAVQTSILAKRWRHCWKYVTNLQFDDMRSFNGLDSFTKFVERVLELYKTTHVKSFRLDFSDLVPNATTLKWIGEATRRDVSELEIRSVLHLELPCPFVCKTLTKLTLVLSRYSKDWNITSSIDLPLLKTLDIKVFTNPNLNAFKIIHGCPLLESLSLEVIYHKGNEGYNFNIPTLKRLELNTFMGIYVKQVVLNVPNLEELFVYGTLWSPVVMEDFPPLVSVTLSCSHGPEPDRSWVELLTELSGAKSLTMHSLSTNLSECKSPMPKFMNLKHFELRDTNCDPLDWLLINQIIESSNLLEHLCIEEKPYFWVEREDSCWIEPQAVPTCMLNNLRTIKFVNFKGRESDIQFMAYMLGNAQVLKTLAIICDRFLLEEELLLTAELSKLPRASRYCEIHFISSRNKKYLV